MRAAAKPNFTLAFPTYTLLYLTRLRKRLGESRIGAASSRSAAGCGTGTRKGTADLRLKRFSAFSSKIVTRGLDVGQRVLHMLFWAHLDGTRGVVKTWEA